MLLNWPTDEIRKNVSARIREQRYQARMRKLKEATGDYWSTHFALWPRRISKHNVVWLGWYQAMESSWGWQYSEWRPRRNHRTHD